MATLIIHPDKIIRSYDEKDRKDEWIEDEDLPYYLGDTVKIEEGVTFGRFMNLLKASPEVYQMFFHVELGGFPLEAYLDDMDNDGEDDDGSQDITSIRVKWVCQIWWLFKTEEAPRIDFYTDLSGRGPSLEDVGNRLKKGEIISWGLDFTPLWQLKHLPLVLEEKFHIYRDDCRDDDHKSSHSDLGEVCRYFDLRDVIGAILDEITFYGLPENRDATAGEIRGRVEDVKEGREKTIPMEDVIKELDEEFKDDEEKEGE
tara:strand:- start:1071 stop:1844 length:774 start_codon:yes stop_codon:yes gene_type:complete